MDTLGLVGTGDWSFGVHVRFGWRVSASPRVALSGEESAYGGRHFVSSGIADRCVVGCRSYRLGNIDFKTGLMIAVGGIVGAQVGPMILQNMSEQNFKRFFAGILVLLAIWLVVQSRSAA